MIDSPNPFVRSLSTLLVRAGWTYTLVAGEPRWTHDRSGAAVTLDSGRHVWLCLPGRRPRLVGSRRLDAGRAAEDVAEQVCVEAARVSMQIATDMP